MLKQEVSPSSQLVVHNLDGELQVFYGSSALLIKAFGYPRAMSESVKLIPRREVLALRAQHHEHGPLTIQHLPSPILFGLDRKVPGLAVKRVGHG